MDTIDGIPKQPIRYDGLQKLIKTRPPHMSMQWCVFSYVLNRDIIMENGEIDDMYGLVIPLGCFWDKKEAEEYAETLIKETKVNTIMTARFACPVPLTKGTNNETVTQVTIDMNNTVEKMDNKEYERENKAFEDQMRRNKEIEIEAEKETHEDDLEYLKRNAFLAIKNYSKYQYHKKLSEKAHQLYESRKANMKKHIKKNPQNKELWLPLLEKKLTERGEGDLLLSIKNGYELIKDEIYL